ncbi:hypothetical protein GF327_01630 [Candidatus Woesearchaeota archaeon]|nr:hypothetical protein [Candidatus Woesearchaeota archaeon]
MVNEILSRYVFFPVWEFFSNRNVFKFYHHLNELEKSQWLPKKQIEEIQKNRIQTLVKHAYKHVPYYRKLFDKNNINYKDIRLKKDLLKIPVLTKEDIQQNLEKLKANNYKKNMLWVNRTGGSTGTPLIFNRDKTTHEFTRAVDRRFRRWAYDDIGTKRFQIWASLYDIKKSKRIKSRIHEYLINHRLINTFDINKQKISEDIKKIIQFRPKVIHGYASSVYFYSQYIKKHNIEIPEIKSVITASETLFPHQRKLIEEVFGCEVFEEYGSREMSLIAHECKAHDGLHIASEKYIVEVIRNENHVKNNEKGKVIITNLVNFAMPFIRYEIGDIAIYSDKKCDCGRNLDKIKSIEGRITDFLIGENNKLVSGTPMSVPFSKLEGVKEYQIVQKELRSIDIYIVKSIYYSQKTKKKINKIMETYIGKGINYNIRAVKKINKSKSGKKRAVICKVNHEMW